MLLSSNTLSCDILIYLGIHNFKILSITLKYIILQLKNYTIIQYQRIFNNASSKIFNLQNIKYFTIFLLSIYEPCRTLFKIYYEIGIQ